jgi:putative oxidoreductase
MRNSLLQSLVNRASAIIASLAFLAPLLTRLVIGEAFFLTGRGKWMNFDRTVDFFGSLGIPFPQANAAFIASLEVAGGIFLILGLGTRLFAALLSCSMVVALLTADRADFIAKFWTAITDVTPAVYLLFLMWLVLYGAGPVSLDQLIGKRLLRSPA